MNWFAWITFLLTFYSNSAHGRQREGVVIRGTTTNPKLTRVAGKGKAKKKQYRIQVETTFIFHKLSKLKLLDGMLKSE